MKHLLLNLTLFAALTGSTMAQNVFPTTAGSNVGIGTTTPAFPLTVNSTINVPTNNAMRPSIRFDSQFTFTDNTSTSRILTATTNATGSNSGAEVNGIYLENRNSLDAGTALALQTGILSYIRISANSTTTNAYSYRAQAFLSGSGSISNTYKAFYATTPSLTGTSNINKVYGLYIEPQKVTGVNLGYGVYQASSADMNYFAGKVGVGVAQPSAWADFSSTDNNAVMRLKTTASSSMGMSQYVLSDNVEDYTIGRGYNTSSVMNRSLNFNVPEVDSYTTNLTQLPKISFTSSAGTNLLGYVESASGNWYMKGFVGIGTTSPKEALSVNGNVRARQVKVENGNWPDYVFSKQYELMPLKSLESFINKNHHLPEIPSADEVNKEGLNLGDMNAKLLKKVEELTLHLINQQKEIEVLKDKIKKIEESK